MNCTSASVSDWRYNKETATFPIPQSRFPVSQCEQRIRTSLGLENNRQI